MRVGKGSIGLALGGCFFLGLIAPFLSAQTIAPEETEAHVGETITVRGTLHSVRPSKAGHLYFNFGDAYPKQLFSVYVSSGKAAEFAEAQTWVGQVVEVTGTVQLRDGKPQMAITSPSQIKLGDEAGGPAPVSPSSSPVPLPAASAPLEKPSSLDDLQPGRLASFTVSLSDAQKKNPAAVGRAARESFSANVVVPKGFDPKREWPILWVSVGSQGQDSLRRMVAEFASVGSRLGWVVLGVEGPGKAGSGVAEAEWVMTEAAWQTLEKKWPGCQNWPFATAGHGSYAANVGWTAAAAVREKHHLLGIFVSSLALDPLTAPWETIRPVGFQTTPVYLAAGSHDATATPAMMETVKKSLEAKGFTKVRLETADNGPLLEATQVEKALQWFAQSLGL
jgi:hypothetical protein